MNIAKNMEAIFLAAAILLCGSAFATATQPAFSVPASLVVAQTNS